MYNSSVFTFWIKVRLLLFIRNTTLYHPPTRNWRALMYVSLNTPFQIRKFWNDLSFDWTNPSGIIPLFLTNFQFLGLTEWEDILKVIFSLFSSHTWSGTWPSLPSPSRWTRPSPPSPSTCPSRRSWAQPPLGCSKLTDNSDNSLLVSRQLGCLFLLPLIRVVFLVLVLLPIDHDDVVVLKDPLDIEDIFLFIFRPVEHE